MIRGLNYRGLRKTTTPGPQSDARMCLPFSLCTSFEACAYLGAFLRRPSRRSELKVAIYGRKSRLPNRSTFKSFSMIIGTLPRTSSQYRVSHDYLPVRSYLIEERRGPYRSKIQLVARVTILCKCYRLFLCNFSS